MTCEEAIAVARRFASDNRLPVGELADAQHTPAGEYARWGLDAGHGDWLIAFHYVGPTSPRHLKATLRTDVGWLLCVQVNDRSGEVEPWQDYRDQRP